MKFLKKVLLLFVLLTCVSSLQAQSKKHYQNLYLEARDLFNGGEYQAAMPIFKEISEPAENNDFVEYSSYFYALSAYNLQDYANANFMLYRLLELYPDWKKIDDVYYLRACIMAGQKNYKKAFEYLDKITSSKLDDDVVQFKIAQLKSIEDQQVIIELFNQYPEDIHVIGVLATRLNRKNADLKERLLLEYLIQDYKLDEKQFTEGLFKRSIMKDTFNVAVLLPLDIPQNQEELPGAVYRKYYEMYDGIQQAVDSLERLGINIKLCVYDTKADTNEVKKILSLEEFRAIDLIVGPVLESNTALVNEYSSTYQVNYVNPISITGYDFASNHHAYFVKPSTEMQAKEAAKYSLENFEGDSLLIFYGSSERDSVAAATYKMIMDSAGKTVLAYRKISISTASIMSDELKKFKVEKPRYSNEEPKPFVQLSHVACFSYQTSESQFMGAYLIGPMEEYRVYTNVIAPYLWLEVNTISFDQFKNKNYHFMCNDWIDLENVYVEDYRRKFKERMKMIAGYKGDRSYALLGNTHGMVGFELMMYFGRALDQYGTLFNEGIAHDKVTDGILFNGFDYTNSNDNGIAPLLKFNDTYQLEWVNKKRVEDGREK